MGGSQPADSAHVRHDEPCFRHSLASDGAGYLALYVVMPTFQQKMVVQMKEQQEGAKKRASPSSSN